jgi:hypothetical protein
MNRISRIFLFGALAIILLAAACAPQEGTPTTVGTLAPGDLTGSPVATDETVTAETVTAETETTATGATPETTETVTPTADTAQLTPTDTTQTPSIPVTGDVILLECQFCINSMAHALLVIPETTTFELTTTATGTETGCNTVDTFDGKQVVLCRAEENTSLILNICGTDGNCTELAVDLEACPVSNTPEPGAATETPTPGGVTDTPQASPTTGGPTSTPTP